MKNKGALLIKLSIIIFILIIPACSFKTNCPKGENGAIGERGLK